MSRPSPDPVRTARPARRALVALAVALLAMVATSCGSSDPETSSTSSTASSAGRGTVAGPGTTEAGGRCVSRMPGEILSAEDAVVHFSPSQVCPGYVTIAPGTPVTFVNEDTQTRTVTVTEGSAGDGAVVGTGTVDAGGTWVQTFDTAGTFTYVTDAIPGFRGAVEVTTGDMAH